MNNFIVPSAPVFYLTRHGFLPWYKIRGAPFPYSHLPPPNINKPKIEVKSQKQPSHHADSNLFVEKMKSVKVKNKNDGTLMEKISQENLSRGGENYGKPLWHPTHYLARSFLEKFRAV